jgi:hypothetical protein
MFCWMIPKNDFLSAKRHYKLMAIHSPERNRS